MKSMIDMQIAVMNEDHDEIRSILSELDRKTESDMFAKAASHFCFKTVEHRGRRLAMRSEIASVMGYKGESGLRMLCERHDLETVSLGAFAQDVRMLVCQDLGLHKFDGKTVFVGWDAFLLAGMESTTDAAKQVKLYLLQMERAGRVAHWMPSRPVPTGSMKPTRFPSSHPVSIACRTTPSDSRWRNFLTRFWMALWAWLSRAGYSVPLDVRQRK